MISNPAKAAQFIARNTEIFSPPHVPEIRLHLASEAFPLWEKTEEELEQIGLPPPFWAFAWAGGQGLARYVLDNPAVVTGRNVLDFASGSGLVAIAAMKAGARSVLAADTDTFSLAAIGLNARLNEVDVTIVGDDLMESAGDWAVVLAGDVFYDKSFADRLTVWFDRLAGMGTEILIGDPGRSYLPKSSLATLATYEVPVSRALEDAEIKRTTVWRWKEGAAS